MNNFITRHLVKKIEDLVREKKLALKSDTYLYFIEPITDKHNNHYIRKLDRINTTGVYNTGHGYINSYYVLKGTSLLLIYDKLKNNEFFSYKKIDGKDHKVRLKKRND